MLIAIAFAAVLAADAGPTAAPPPASEGVDPARAQALAALPASDEDIRRSLFEMLARDPERVVCSVRVGTGSRQARTTCSSLRRWFNARRPDEIAEGKAPWQLVEEIKDQRRKALMRMRREG